MRRPTRLIRAGDIPPTPEEAAWIERVWERHERRRDLPRRRLNAAVAEALRPLSRLLRT